MNTLRDQPRAGLPGRRTVNRAGLALVDQVLSSGSGLLVVLAVAHIATPATLGAVSMALIVNGFLLGSLRAMVGEILLIRCGKEGADRSHETGTSLALAITAAALAAAAVAGIGALAGGTTGQALVLVALAVPFIFVQDVLRYAAYSADRVGDAVVLDGIWFGVQVLITAGLIASGRETPGWILLAWGIGAAVSAATGWARTRLIPRLGGVSSWVRRERTRMASFLTDFLISTGLVQASMLVLGTLVFSLSEFGRFRLAAVAITPLANALAGVRVLTLARLAATTGGSRAGRRAAVRFGAMFGGVALGYLVLLVALPVAVGTTALGDSWPLARNLALVIAAGEVFRVTTFAAIDYLKVFGSPLTLVRRRIPASMIVVSSTLIGGIVAGPMGAGSGMALAMVIAAAIWWTAAFALGARPSAPTTPPPAGGVESSKPKVTT